MGISLSDLLILMVIGLILFGPEDLPDVARAVGRVVREIKKMTGDVTKEFQDVINTPTDIINKALEDPVKSSSDNNNGNTPLEAGGEPDNTETKEELLTYDDAGLSSSLRENEEQDNDGDPLTELPSDMVSYSKDSQKNKGASR